MGVRTGILLVGAKRTSHGRTGAVDGFALIDDQEVPVIAKQLSNEKILAEVFCAKLGNFLGLVCPEPLLLKGQQDNQIYFGSLKYPNENMSQYLNISFIDSTWRKKFAILLNEWSSFHKAISFDEWISNRDRNTQNILWAEKNDFVLIDHENTLNLALDLDDQNQLVSAWIWHSENTDSEKEKLRKKVAKYSRGLTVSQNDTLNQLQKELSCFDANEILNNFIDFTSRRLSNLTRLVNDRFPEHLFSRGVQ